MPYLIRKANYADLNSLVEMARTSFVQAFTEGNKTENVNAYLEEAFTEEQFTEELENPASVFFLLEVDGDLAGYAKVNFVPAQTDLHDNSSLEVARLYLLEKYIGMGLGKVLLNHTINFAKLNRKKYLWLGVWEKNKRAIKFYEKHGLSIFSSHPFPFGDELQTDFLMKIAF
ncbi:GNAT family N-acetyltransferase [Algoriphagus aquimarinus]|uniref:Ribosomal protein S18 acetylase RimI n=1 Tax=Algoriphagus aquimarinus TaxID=237018 RepID=A0A1I1B4L0_9BACT|nr:GNAT family N-acetyltransferase [Algoriphagus aquimarinus]SFB44576.1 Ribosomal protein S18 acetylase RimI [Algoriphagus aquimarinus]|tara:strand:- start:80552 stop:81067 length:516 start_codon:yes stop_codon:yes gene_type:complete